MYVDRGDWRPSLLAEQPRSRRSSLIFPSKTDFFGAFLGGFGVFVMLSCAVVVASAIGARTVARRRVIGLYKAIGYTSREVGVAILLEHLAIAFVACAAGNLLAAVVAPRFRVG